MHTPLYLIVDDKSKIFFAGDTFNIIISYGTRYDHALEKDEPAKTCTHFVFLLVRSHVASVWAVWEVNFLFIASNIIATNIYDCNLR